MKPSILFSHRATNVPIIKRLSNDGEYNLICVDGYTKDFYSTHKIENFSSFVNIDKSNHKISQLSETYNTKMEQIAGSTEFFDTLKRIFPITDEKAERISDRFIKITRSILPKIFYTIIGLECIIEKRDLRLLVIHDVPPGSVGLCQRRPIKKVSKYFIATRGWLWHSPQSWNRCAIFESRLCKSRYCQ